MDRFADKTFVLGIGAAKAGTTWLHRYLESRPDSYMSPIKELHYFDAKYRDELTEHFNNRFIERLVDRVKRGGFGGRKPHAMGEALLDRAEMIGNRIGYREYFEKRVPGDCLLFGEVTPSYALLPVEGFREIKRQFPRLRIVYLLRDPIERFHSQLRMAVRKGHIESASEVFLEKLKSPHLTERSFYNDTIARLDEVFAPEEVHVAFFETFFNDDAVGALCEFLGCPFLPGEYQKRVNPGGEPEKDGLNQAVIDAGLEEFAGVYTFCRDRFGDRVPDSWLG